MKKLYNNFTTVEQSKWLLELGITADSADCYLTRFGIDEDWEVKVLNNVKYSEIAISNQEYCLPCWSVGWLIEILETCWTDRIEPPIWYNYPSKGRTIIERVLWDFDNRKLDFSKLEE